MQESSFERSRKIFLQKQLAPYIILEKEPSDLFCREPNPFCT